MTDAEASRTVTVLASQPPGRIQLIGVPTDIGAGVRGASMGPEALRVAGIGDALARHGLEVYDSGNLLGPANPWSEPEGGFRHLQQCILWNRLVHDAVYEAMGEERMPVMLGGDHSVGIGSISAVARHCRESGKRLLVLWLDAHADFNTSDITPGVGTGVQGGPTYREAQLCMEMIADSGRLASLDIVEINPALDVRNQTALLVVDLVESLFGKSTLMRRQR